MLTSGLKRFKAFLPTNEKDNIIVIPEISMSQILDRGHVDTEDFLARVDLLSALGQKVLLSNSGSFSDLNLFFTKYAKKNIAFVLSTYNLEELFSPSKYENSKMGMLGSIGTLLEPKTKLYIYPAYDEATKKIKNIESLELASELRPFLLYLTENKFIENITEYNEDVIHIWSRKVLGMIQEGVSGWEKLVPPSVAETVKKKCLFGAKCDL
jgi:hypothetical protein